jgi:TonB-dependent starch-binding outer membrane protein SusC
MQILFCRHLPVLPFTAIKARKPRHCFIAGFGIKQIMRVMKLTAFILLVACLQVSAGANSQSITLSLRGATLERVFVEIKKQSGYYFIYEEGLLQRARKVDIEVKDVSIKQVLDTCFVNQPLTYKIINKIIVVKNKEFAEPNASVQDPIDVKGRVTDKDGNPLSGANVKIKGTNIGTTTDQNGNYELKGIDENAVLEITYVGHETQIVAVRNKQIINAALSVSVRELDATVIKGYYTTTRRLNTGNVSKVTSETIENQPVPNPLQALQGRVAGLQIKQNTGVPGGNFTVRLRGQSSIANGNDPLYVIDGVPFSSTNLSANIATIFFGGTSPLYNINPSDIESIEVLKDADATAIYGSRGSNGVILITTKKGKQGKTQVDLNFYSGAGKITRKLNLLNTEQYVEMRKEALKNDGSTATLANSYDLLVWDTTRYTDWQKALIGGTANTMNAQASISGGNINTQYSISGGYYRETTVFPGDFFDHKFNGHFSIVNATSDQKLKSVLTGSFVSDNNNLTQIDFTSVAMTLPPNAPPLYDSGKLNWGTRSAPFFNPFGLLLRKYQSNTTSLISNLHVQYQLFPELLIKTSLGYTQINFNENVIRPISSLPPYFPITTGVSTFADNSIKTWILEPQLEYKKRFTNVRLEALFGSTLQQNVQNMQTLFGEGYSNDALLENIGAASKITVQNSNYSKYRYNAFFGRINFDYQEKYLINMTGRRDGSSRFGPGKRFGNFGAIGIGWIFSREKFTQNVIPFLNHGKFRFSYGITGNDQFTDYVYLSTYSTTNYTYFGSVGLYPTRLYNPDFRWETNKKLEIALEFALLNNRILVTADYYRNRTSNQLVGYPLPLITGGSSVQYNLPAIVQNTGWEFELNTTNFQSSKYSWKTSLNLTFPANRLIAYPDIEKSPYANRYVNGQSLFIQKKFHFIGVDPNSGLYVFEDVDGDGNISFPNDLQGLKEVSQKYYGGIQNNIRYKNWNIDFLVQFVKQTAWNYLFNSPFSDYSPGMMANQPTFVLNRWQKSGDETNIQKFSQSFGIPYSAYSKFAFTGDNTIVDGSFIRLKNISLSYQLLERWKQKVHLQNFKVYVQGQNLFTITNYQGLDPETQSGINLPPLKVIVLGIQITI